MLLGVRFNFQLLAHDNESEPTADELKSFISGPAFCYATNSPG